VLFAQEGHDPYLEKVHKSAVVHPLNWLICNDCGFIYRSPVLTEHELDVLYQSYDQDVFAHTTPDEYFDKIISFSKDESENWQKIAWLKQVINEIGKEDISSALDIGCGGGTLLFTAREQLSLTKVNGVELNETYAELARRRLDTSVLNTDYSSGLFNRKFDLLINTKVLEHVSDPIPFLKEMYEDLVDGGLLFIEVPDISDIYSLPPAHERFWIPHIYFFSCNTLTVLLATAGFQVISHRVITTHRNRSYLQFLAEKSKALTADTSSKPYDDIAGIKELVAFNLENHNK